MTDEMLQSRSVMVVDVTDIDLAAAARLFVLKEVEEDIVTQFFRLKGGKFIMLVNSVLSEDRWNIQVKPELVKLFGLERCRFETRLPSKLMDELLTREEERRDTVEEC